MSRTRTREIPLTTLASAIGDRAAAIATSERPTRRMAPIKPLVKIGGRK